MPRKVCWPATGGSVSVERTKTLTSTASRCACTSTPCFLAVPLTGASRGAMAEASGGVEAANFALITRSAGCTSDFAELTSGSQLANIRNFGCWFRSTTSCHLSLIVSAPFEYFENNKLF